MGASKLGTTWLHQELSNRFYQSLIMIRCYLLYGPEFGSTSNVMIIKDKLIPHEPLVIEFHISYTTNFS